MEATRLTREGRLAEAMAVLQGARAGGDVTTPAADGNHHADVHRTRSSATTCGRCAGSSGTSRPHPSTSSAERGSPFTTAGFARSLVVQFGEGELRSSVIAVTAIAG
jgi:hypothetical protein